MNNMIFWFHKAAFVAALVAVGMVARGAAAVEVGWTFDDATLTPRFNDHTTSMVFAGNGTDTSSVVTFAAVSTFPGVPAIPGGDDKVMKFPAFQSFQGLALYDLGPANGGGSYVNKYTMAWDVLIPDVAANWFAFYNTNAGNANDADSFVQPFVPPHPDAYVQTDGLTNGVGSFGEYHGHIDSNVWYRIVIVHDATSSSLIKYVNGTFVGTSSVDGVDGTHTLYTDTDVNTPPFADAFLLTDDSGDTNAGYISAYYYTDSAVDAITIAGWGSPKSFGLPGPGDVNFDGVVNIFDINLVSSNWNGAGPTGDANHDGIVNIFDINLISSNWSPAAAQSVPEPSAWLLLSLGLAGLVLGRRAIKG